MKPEFSLSEVRRLALPNATDADGHVLEPADLWEQQLETKFRDRALRLRTDADGLEYLEIGGAPSKLTRKGYPAILGRMGDVDEDAFVPSPERTYMTGVPYGAMDPDERVKLLDAENLVSALLYPTLGIMWEAELTEVELSQAYCRAYNRWIADFCRASKGRLVPVAHLSLGHPEAAARELARAVDDGCRGAFVAPFTLSHKAHGDPVHDVVWQVAQDLDVPIAIHPCVEPIALRTGRFENGHRFTMLGSATAGDGVRQAFTTFMDFGTFDRFPRLKLVLLESGGGWVGPWLDRLDAVWEGVFGDRDTLSQRPSEYFRRQCYISCDPDEHYVGALMERLGADRFFWASDYPHPDHTADYLAELERMVENLPEHARAGILGSNVREAFGC